MSEKYRLIKHNENLAEIGNDRGVGLLFLVDEDCERKLAIIVDLLNNQQSIIEQLQEENKGLKHWKKRIIEYLTDWFNKTEYLTVLYKINEINNEIGLDNDE